MKVGLVGPVPPPAGGMAMQTLQLKDLLQAEGLQVELLPTNGPYKPAWAENLKGLRAVFRLLPYLGKLWALCARVDVIHLMANSGWSWLLFSAPAIVVAKLRGTPLLINYRGGEAGAYLRRNSWHVRPLMRCAEALVVPSNFLKQVFGDYKLESKVIPNIVRLERFSGEKQSRHQGQHLVITRNLEPIYGIPTAIKALQTIIKTYPGAYLSIAGSGPARDDLKALVAQLDLGEHVSFLGRLDREEIDALYQSADVLLNPTTVDNMPNSLLEAMAARVAIVSSDVGGVPYIVKHEQTALLVPVGDHNAMADAVNRLFGDKVLHQHLLDSAQEDVQAYAWPVVKTQWLKLYREVAGV